MNLLKALFSTPITEPSFYEQPGTEGEEFAGIEPLWTNCDQNQAKVTEPIQPDALGRVKFQGTWWRALCDRPLTLEAGTIVRVVGRQRCSILIVEPIPVGAYAL